MATETLVLSSLAPEAGEFTSASQRCRKPLEHATLPTAMSRLVRKPSCVPSAFTRFGKE